MRYIVYTAEDSTLFFDSKLEKAFKIDEEGDVFTINLPVKIDSEEAFLKYLQPYYSVREETDMWPYKGERYIVAVCEDMVTYFFDHKEQAAYALKGGKEEMFYIKEKDNFAHHVEQFGILDFFESNERPTACAVINS
jgi:hypothetical protein